MTPAHGKLLQILRLRSGPQAIYGGRPAFTKAEAIEIQAKEAWEEFAALERIQALDDDAREVVKRLFLQGIVLLNVASGLDSAKAEGINRVSNEIMKRLLAKKPRLALVK